MTTAEVAQVGYTEAQIRLDDLARDVLAAGNPLTARVIRHEAAIAYRAARAERLDPEPEIRACSICGGIRHCVEVS